MKVIIAVIFISVVVHGLDNLIGDYETRLKQGQLIATIPQLFTSYKISFNLKLNSYKIGIYNILQFTTGEFIAQYGGTAPEVGLRVDDPRYSFLYIIFSKSGNPDVFTDTENIPLNVWTNIVINQQVVQNKSFFSIEKNGVNLFSIENNLPQKIENIKVFACNPWYPPQDGWIKNLNIRNGAGAEYVANAVLATRYLLDSDKEEAFKKNNLIAVLSTLEETYDIGFDLKLSKYEDQYTRFLSLMITNTEIILNVGILSSKAFLISSTVYGAHLVVFYVFPLNQWVSIHIRKTGGFDFIVEIDRKIVLSSTATKNPQAMKNLLVYASDPWNRLLGGYIKNFKVVQGNQSPKKMFQKF